MAVGNMGGAGGSWVTEEDEKKRKERLRNTNSVLGMSGLGQIANETAARNKAAQVARTSNNTKPQSVANNTNKPADSGLSGKGIPVKQPLRDSYVDTSDSENPTTNGMSRGNSGKGFGFSADNNPAVAKPLAPAMGGGNSGFGFRVKSPPRKAYGEDSRRQALAMDIKPYKNGMGLTTSQIALKNSILNGDDEKYANEQYTTQMDAAQRLAQESMQQSGANSRAELSERGANNRANQQLGFDIERFQQVAALDKRKLDMQQANDGVSNFLPKRLIGLYKKYDAAETDEDRTAIAEQIQSLSGNNGKSDKEYWTSINGGERVIDPNTGATEKLPDILLNRNTGETRAIPREPIDYATDVRAQAIINDTSISKEERRKQLEALR